MALILLPNPWIFVEQMLQAHIGISVHRTIFDASKEPTILPDTYGMIEDRTRRFGSYGNGNHDGERQNRDTEQKCQGDVEAPLQPLRLPAWRLGRVGSPVRRQIS
jgi:hypothetical protein